MPSAVHSQVCDADMYMYMLCMLLLNMNVVSVQLYKTVWVP